MNNNYNNKNNNDNKNRKSNILFNGIIITKTTTTTTTTTFLGCDSIEINLVKNKIAMSQNYNFVQVIGVVLSECSLN